MSKEYILKIKKQMLKEENSLKSLRKFKVFLIELLDELQKSGNNIDKFLPKETVEDIIFVREELNKLNNECLKIKSKLFKQDKYKIRNINSAEGRAEVFQGENLELIL